MHARAEHPEESVWLGQPDARDSTYFREELGNTSGYRTTPESTTSTWQDAQWAAPGCVVLSSPAGGGEAKHLVCSCPETGSGGVGVDPARGDGVDAPAGGCGGPARGVEAGRPAVIRTGSASGEGSHLEGNTLVSISGRVSDSPYGGDGGSVDSSGGAHLDPLGCPVGPVG